MGRRLRLSFCQPKPQPRNAVALFQGRKLSGRRADFCGISRLIPLILLQKLLAQSGLPVNRLPALALHHLSPGRKYLSVHRHLKACLFVLAGRIEHRQETPHHKIIDPPLVHRHVIQLHKFLRGNDGVVIRHLGVIDKEGLLRKGTVHQPPGKLLIGAHPAGRQPLLNRRKDVGAKISGVRPGIRQHLMVFVKPLHNV